MLLIVLWVKFLSGSVRAAAMAAFNLEGAVQAGRSKDMGLPLLKLDVKQSHLILSLTSGTYPAI